MLHLELEWIFTKQGLCAIFGQDKMQSIWWKLIWHTGKQKVISIKKLAAIFFFMSFIHSKKYFQSILDFILLKIRLWISRINKLCVASPDLI